MNPLLLLVGAVVVAKAKSKPATKVVNATGLQLYRPPVPPTPQEQWWPGDPNAGAFGAQDGSAYDAGKNAAGWLADQAARKGCNELPGGEYYAAYCGDAAEWLTENVIDGVKDADWAPWNW